MANVIGLNPDGTPIFDNGQSQIVTGLNPDGTPIFGNSNSQTQSAALQNGLPLPPQGITAPNLATQGITSSPSDSEQQTAQTITQATPQLGQTNFPNIQARMGANYSDTPDLAAIWLNKKFGNQGFTFKNDPTYGLEYSATPNDPNSWNEFQSTFPSSFSDIIPSLAQKLPDLTELGLSTGGAIAGLPLGIAGVIGGSAAGGTSANAIKQEIGNYIDNLPPSDINKTELLSHALAGAIGPIIGEQVIGPAIAKTADSTMGETIGDALTNDSNPFQANGLTQVVPQNQPINPLSFLGKNSGLNQTIRKTNSNFVSQALGNGAGSLQDALMAGGTTDSIPLDASSSELNQALQKSLLNQKAVSQKIASGLYGPLKEQMSEIPFSLDQKQNLLDDIANNSTNFMNPAATQKTIAISNKLSNVPITSAEDLLNFIQSAPFKSATSDIDPNTNRELASLTNIFQNHLQNALEESPNAVNDLAQANNYYSSFKNNLEPITDALESDKSDSGYNTVNTVRNNIPPLQDLEASANNPNQPVQDLSQSLPLYQRGLAKQLSDSVMNENGNPNWSKLSGYVNNPTNFGYLNQLVGIPNSAASNPENDLAQKMLESIQDISENPDLRPENGIDREGVELGQKYGAPGEALNLLKDIGWGTLNVLRNPALAPFYRPYTTLGTGASDDLADKFQEALSRR